MQPYLEMFPYMGISGGGSLIDLFDQWIKEPSPDRILIGYSTCIVCIHSITRGIPAVIFR